MRHLNRLMLHTAWYIMLKEYLKGFFLAHYQYITRTLFTIFMLGIVADFVSSNIHCSSSKLVGKKKMEPTSKDVLNLEKEIKEERAAFSFYRSIGIGNIPYEGN